MKQPPCWASRPSAGGSGEVADEGLLQRKNVEDTRDYISSVTPDAGKLLNAVRKHWYVDNQLHWTFDVTFREDESRIRTGGS
jgi:predicted transposase YbfD/YdcC